MNTGGRPSASSGDDELLFRLYQQITQHQAAQFVRRYDIAAGLGRYQVWLHEHSAEDQASREATEASPVMALPMGSAEIGAVNAGPGPGVALTADPATREHAGTRGQIPAVAAGWDAERAVTMLYGTHYRTLVRLAAMLVGDIHTAEEVVQDSFIALHSAWRRLADSDRALAYLRRSVVNRCRSVLRHRVVVDKLTPKATLDIPGLDQEQMTLLERSALTSALRALPPRQREALVLRYYADLSETQIAAAMGISKGAVKSHTARAISSLRRALRAVNE
jgi:RNA polymerase sigma-70 factor (sigma-E family)